MVIAVCGVVASIIGFFLVKTKKETQKDLIFALRRGVISSAIFIVIASGLIINFFMGKNYWGVWLSIIIGLGAGILLGISTEYFTSSSFSPTRILAQSSLTGPAATIISGISLGMLSTAIPIFLICAAVFFSFYFSGGFSHYGLGLYGIGIASVGLLSTLGITLASEAYGPVADNAGGIAQMAQLEENIRRRTDQLDALGNTTAATGKGFAIGERSINCSCFNCCL